MKTRITAYLLLVLALCIGPASAEVKGLKAFCREGQTFMTWQEDGADWYYVYASAEPITKTAGLKWIAKIPKGSNKFRFPHITSYRGSKAKSYKRLFEGKPWAYRIQIEPSLDSSKCLPDGTGLFVRTIKKDGATHYAVVSDEGAAVKSGGNALARAVGEKVGLPGAVLVYKKKNLNFFVFFTDFDVWNVDGVDDHMHGYAHVFSASIGPRPANPAPLTVRLHAYSAWGGVFMPYTWPIYDGVSIAMFDYSLTWWFGHSEALKEVSKTAPAGKVVNYTEQRLMQVIRWVASSPKGFPVKIDAGRIYVMGGSMGGSGANHIACKQGDIVAAAQASKGYTNWALSPKIKPFAGKNRVNVFLGDFYRKYGTLEDNNPTNLGGKGVYDVLNLTSWVSDPTAKVGYLDTANGSIDGVIPFWGLAAFWDALEKGKHPYSSGWAQVGHASRLGSGSPMAFNKLRSDESIPAMANASCNTPLKYGVRLMGKIKEVLKDGIRITNPIVHDIKGMTLVVGRHPSIWFKVASVKGDLIRIVEGDLIALKVPVTKWQKSQLKIKLKRKPTEADLKKQADKNKTNYLVIDGDPQGTRNGYIAWSTTLQNFDKKTKADDIVDTEKKWAMSFRVGKNYGRREWKEDTATVDITPRRCQQFRPAVGAKVHWENWDHSDKARPAKVAEGDVTVDKYGLVTVPKFLVGKKGLGNRLVLKVQ
jgi:hypothetical protein